MAIFGFCPKGDGQPVECTEEWFCGVESALPQQDPGSRVLYMLLRDPMKESVTVLQPGRDEGVDREGECGAEFGERRKSKPDG